jgi:4-hydroxybenzoate polyprenyltransferase
MGNGKTAQSMNKLQHYFSLIKFSHTIFALPFALTGFFEGIIFDANEQGDTSLALQSISAYFATHATIFIFILLCMVFARSAAMAFNRYLDWEFDARNPRTANREIPRGLISPKAALGFTIANSALFCISAGMINNICLFLSPIALVVILGYSFTKRFTALCHIVLGVGLALAPVGAFMAVTEQITPGIVLLAVSVLTWVSGFDIIYALQDAQFDQQQGLLSIPAIMGTSNALLVSKILHVVSSLCMFLSGFLFNASWLFWGGALLFTFLLIWQHRLVKPDDLSKVDIAFMTTNGMASILFSVMAILDIIILH